MQTGEAQVVPLSNLAGSERPGPRGIEEVGTKGKTRRRRIGNGKEVLRRTFHHRKQLEEKPRCSLLMMRNWTRGLYGTLDAEFEVQHTIKRAELTASFLRPQKAQFWSYTAHVDNKGIIDGL